MRHEGFLGKTIIFILLWFFFLTGCAVAREKSCDTVGKELEQQKRRLAEYSDALRNLKDRENPQTSQLLNYKINQLIIQLRKSEEEMEDCLDESSPTSLEGLGPIKSETSQYAAMSCDQLRAELIGLLRSSSNLRTREHSLFTALTTSEKDQLMEAREKMRLVVAALNQKCPEPSAGRSRSPKSSRH